MSSQQTRSNPRNNLRRTVDELGKTVRKVNEETYQLELAAAKKKAANAKAVSNAATQKRKNMERSSTPQEKAIQAAYGSGARGRPGITGAVSGAYSAAGQRQAANAFGAASIAEQGRGFRGPEITGTANQRAQSLLNNATRRRSTGTGVNNRPTPTVRPIESQLVPSSIPTSAFGKRPVIPSVPVNLPVAVSPVNTSNTLRAERAAAILAAATARTRITTLEGQIAALIGPNAANRRAALQQELNAERARAAIAEGQIGTLQMELATARAALAAATTPEEIARLQELINTLSGRLTAETTRANEAVSRLSGHRAYANTQTARAVTLEGELTAARQALAAAQAGVADPAEITRLQGDINRLTGEVAAAQANATSARSNLGNFMGDLATAERERNAALAAAAAYGPGSLDPTAVAALTAERNTARAAAAAFGLGSLDPAAAAALQQQLVDGLNAQLNAAQNLLGSLDAATAATIQLQLTAIQSQITAAQIDATAGTLLPATVTTIQTALTNLQTQIAAALNASGPPGGSGGPSGPSGGPSGPSGGPPGGSGGPSGPSGGPSGKKGPCAPGSGWRCQKPTKGGRRRRIRRKHYTRR